VTDAADELPLPRPGGWLGFLARLPGGRPVARRLTAPPTVAVLRLYGVIGPKGGPFGGALNLAAHAGAIERAFRLRGLKAVALAVNSPGGSPVQSALLHDRIRVLAAERKVPVFAFCEDVAASGGYWIALAADEIYADAASIVGSIGVISSGFGFQDLIARIGVERRVHTSGERKSFLDPFRPEEPEHVARLAALQADIHAGFRAHVEARRAGRLKAPAEALFDGSFWTGRRALELGLIDGLGDLRTVMRARYGEKVRLRAVEPPRRGWLMRRLGLERGDPLGEGADALLAAVARRGLWGRFGL